MTADVADVVRRFYEVAINGRAIEAIDDLVDVGYVNHGPFPWGVTNRDDLEHFEFVADVAFPDAHVVIDDMITAGDRVAYRLTMQATDTGEFVGIQPTGQRVEFAGMGFARIVDGRICETWGLIDDLGVIAQLGVNPRAIGTLAPER
jgi:predicted ester cyclase